MWRFALAAAIILVAAAMMSASARGETTSPPLDADLMPQSAEIALAKSAAPATISDHATIKVLTDTGFEVVSEGDNGFVCLVMRGWSAPTYTPAQFRDLVYDPTVHAPICFDPNAARTVLPYYALRTKLGMAGKTPDQIAAGLEATYAWGELPKRDGVSFAYMWSADQDLGGGLGAWHPHVMVFAPYYENAMVGGNAIQGNAEAALHHAQRLFDTAEEWSDPAGLGFAHSRWRSPGNTVAILHRRQPPTPKLSHCGGQRTATRLSACIRRPNWGTNSSCKETSRLACRSSRTR
jgi:hypothetical protein